MYQDVGIGFCVFTFTFTSSKVPHPKMLISSLVLQVFLGSNTLEFSGTQVITLVVGFSKTQFIATYTTEEALDVILGEDFDSGDSISFLSSLMSVLNLLVEETNRLGENNITVHLHKFTYMYSGTSVIRTTLGRHLCQKLV